MSARTLVPLVTIPALLCAAIGLTHPGSLDATSAPHWRDMHLVLMPLFPLVGAGPWLIARRGPRWTGVTAAVFGYVFAVFYTALDILAGVAGGALVAAGHPDATAQVFAIARVVSVIGVGGLVVAVLAAGVAVYRIAGVTSLPGILIAAIGAGLIQPGHIYPGPGTLAMGLLAGGLAILAVLATRPPKTP